MSGGGSLAEVSFIAEGDSRDLGLRITEVDLLDAEGGLNTLGSKEVEFLPERIVLHQNMPNPFNAGTVIYFELPREAKVHLEIYDILGRLVRRLVEGSYGGGVHLVRWDGRDGAGSEVASGVYIVRLEAGERLKQVAISRSRRITLLR